MLVLVAVGFAVVNGLLLLWMLALTRHAWRTLPPGAQVPVHGGPGGWDKWRPKESALLIWPVIAGLIWLVNLGMMIYTVTDAAARSADGASATLAVLILPMIILLVSERLALKAAVRAANDSGVSALGDVELFHVVGLGRRRGARTGGGVPGRYGATRRHLGDHCRWGT